MRTWFIASSIVLAACRGEPVSAPVEAAPPTADDDTETEPGLEGDEDQLPVVEAGSGGALLGEVERELAAMRISQYTHTTRVDEATGTFDYDCSGLVDYALARAAPDALDELRHATAKRPLAKHFVALVASLGPDAKVGRWHRISRAQDLRPGDIVAWLKPADVHTRNTGHVMVVRDAVAPVPGHPGEIAVPVIDSTSVRHGADDSRYRTKSTGLGTGTIYLTVDSAGIPRGYVWSHGKKAREHATTIALARIE